MKIETKQTVGPTGNMRKRDSVRPNLVRHSVAAILAGVPLAFPVNAQAQERGAADKAELEEVTVTGSRIARRELEANSPLVTVDTAALETKSGLNIESYLNQLPAFNPAASPVTTYNDVQISAVNSVGVSTISLRGFGPNRSLVLVNGHRPTPINALMVTDINEVPSSMIRRVEIISGGASAVYGADAIGGVTNFILRDDFQGIEADLQRAQTEAGDGDETRGYAMMGTNVGEGRGNLTLGAEYYRRDEALRRNRDFNTNAWSDPNTATADLFVFGYNGYNTGFGNAPSQPSLRAVFDQTAANENVCTIASTFLGTRCGLLAGFRFNADGTLFNPNGPIGRSNYKGPNDTGEFSLQNTFDTTTTQQGVAIQSLKWNNPQALVEAPQTRYSFFGSGKWEFTDNLNFFTRAHYAQSKTRTLLFPTNASFGWEAQIPYNPTTDSPINPALDYGNRDQIHDALVALRANPADPTYANPGFIAHGQAGAQHPVPLELAVLLNSRGPEQMYCLAGSAGCGGPNATTDKTLVGTPRVGAGSRWIAETFPKNSFPQRATLNTNTVWQIETGFNFKLPAKDWTGELYWSRGESSTYNNAFGNNSLARWRALVTAADYGRNSTLFGNSGGASPNFGTVPVPCTSGFYETLFGDGTNADAPPSADCQYAAEAQLQTRTQNQQDIGELNFQGGLFDGWAGEFRGALGFQYRKNAAQFVPDILQSTASFNDQVIGVYPTGPLDASLNVKDYYVELLAPLVSDLRFLKKFELELGGRQSEYSVTDSTFTYKINSNIEVNDWVRFRGGFNKATRAPNLGELYLNLQEIFTGDGRFGDPCGVRSNAPFGAGGSGPDPVLTSGEPPTQLASGQTASGAQSSHLICEAQMGAAAAAAYYGSNAPPASGGQFAWVFQEGNSQLESEKANTWTAGVVFTSHANSAWLSGLSAAVDWWKVDIEDAIQQYSIDFARYLCYGTVQVTDAAGAAAQAATPACRNVPRNRASGGATTMLLRYDNQATIATSGIDLQLNWLAGLSDLGLGRVPGRVGMSVQASFLDYYKTKQSSFAFDAETDWKGSLGPTLTGTNSGAYSYRLNTSFSYMLPSWNFNLRWRHLPSVWAAAKAAEDAIIENNERVAAGGDGVILSYTPGTAIKTPNYDVFDLSLTWSINDKFMLRAGIDNLFDKEPLVIGDNGLQPNATGARRGYPDAASIAAACTAETRAKGCVNPTNAVVPSSGMGFTSPGYYDVLGRRYFLGFKATF